ncbi:hypothetical protein D3C80_1324620 [compost metagenome]
MGNQRQRLLTQVVKPLGIPVRCQAPVQALDFHPVARRCHRGQKRLAMDHALALQGQGFGKDGGRIDRIDEIDGTVQTAFLVVQAHHLGHQLHQPALAPIGVAAYAGIGVQHARRLDGIVGTPHGVQAKPELAYAGLAGAQPGEQGRVLGLVVKTVGS